MKKIFFLSFLIALSAPGLLNAAILYQANNVTYAGNSLPTLALSTPMTKTDTYYVQYTVELTSSIPPTGDPNSSNSSYPNVPIANATTGGASFLFYLGGGYNSDNLFSSGFSTSTWTTNQFSASDYGGTRQSTGMVAQYSTQPSAVIKFQIDLTLRMGSGTYDYTVTKLNGAGAVVQSVTLSNLDLDRSNYWNNNSSFSTLTFASSTSQMTAKFDRIIVSDTAIAPIPEPGTFVLAGAGIAFLSLSRRRRKA